MKTENTKVIFTPLVMQKIEYMCAIRPTKEWCGVPFYRVNNHTDSGNTIISVEDFALMEADGSETFTSFNDMDDAYANAYISNHRNLLGCYMGLLHSHHNMAPIPSGIDDKTMIKEANAPDRTNFLSIIVCNDRGKNDYNVRISQKRRTEVKAGNSYINEFGEEKNEGESAIKFKDYESLDTIDITNRAYMEPYWTSEQEKEFVDRVDDLAQKKIISNSKRQEDDKRPFFNEWRLDDFNTRTLRPLVERSRKEYRDYYDISEYALIDMIFMLKSTIAPLVKQDMNKQELVANLSNFMCSAEYKELTNAVKYDDFKDVAQAHIINLLDAILDKKSDSESRKFLKKVEGIAKALPKSPYYDFVVSVILDYMEYATY